MPQPCKFHIAVRSAPWKDSILEQQQWNRRNGNVLIVQTWLVANTYLVPGIQNVKKMSFFITWYYMVNRYHPTRTLTRTLARTLLWSDQCLDAVAREGSRLIRPAWMLCLKIFNVDWTLMGPPRDAVGYCITTYYFIRIKHRTRANDILCKTKYY